MFIRLKLKDKEALFNIDKIHRVIEISDDSVDYHNGLRSRLILEDGAIRVRDTVLEIQTIIDNR